MTIAKRIAALPEAVNIAKPFQAELTQEKSGVRPAASRETKNITEISRLSTSLYAADDSDYSRADAVNKQWRKMNTVNILDVLDGTADTSNRTLKLSDLEKRLQESGLDEVDDTDLSMLKFEFSGLRFEADAPYPSVRENTFRKNVEYLASRYAAMEERIKNTYTGKEQKQWLDKLDALYQDTLKRTAGEYAELVGGILKEYGVSGEKEKLFASFQSGVEELTDRYRQFLKENEGFTGLEGTVDEWLLQDDEYIAARLREQNLTAADSGRSAEYTLRDLEVLGQYASGLSAMAAKADTYEMNEERMGLELAMLAMKTDELKKNGGVSTSMGAVLKETLHGYINSFINQFERKLSEKRAHALISSDIQGNAVLDQKSIWNVYNRTMESWRTSGDALKALASGAQYGRAQYAQKMSRPGTKDIYRYKNGSGYWNQFFEDTAIKRNGYQKDGTTYGKYVMNWLNFTDSLKEGKNVRLNMELGSVDSCLEGWPGRLVDVEV